MFLNLPLLRLAIATILVMHSVPTLLDGTVNDFGRLYLDEKGFYPFGVPLAWTIKILHVLCALGFLLNKFLRIASLIMICILIAGIVMVHGPEGWYVVGGGRNGVEFNFLLIAVFATFLFPQLSRHKEVLQA